METGETQKRGVQSAAKGLEFMEHVGFIILSCLLPNPQCLPESGWFANQMSDFLSQRFLTCSPPRLEAGGACTRQPHPSSLSTLKTGISGMGRRSTPSSFFRLEWVGRGKPLRFSCLTARNSECPLHCGDKGDGVGLRGADVARPPGGLQRVGG